MTFPRFWIDALNKEVYQWDISLKLVNLNRITDRVNFLPGHYSEIFFQYFNKYLRGPIHKDKLLKNFNPLSCKIPEIFLVFNDAIDAFEDDVEQTFHS